MIPKWLDWAQRLNAVAQNGLTYATNPYDIERFNQIREIAAEVIAEHSDVPFERTLDLLAREDGYMTPKIDVRGVVFQDDKILLVKEKVDGGWTLPGGWVDIGDSPSDAVTREIREESGYKTRAVKMLAVLDRNKHGHPAFIYHLYKLFILCELTGGAPCCSIETDGVEFFAEDEIPNLSVGRVTREQIARLFEHHRNPDLPTDFD